MGFIIRGLDPTPFRHLYGKPDGELRHEGVIRQTVDSVPGYPDRIELRDADIGRSVLLLNHEHQPAATPFRSRYAIYVREGATAAAVYEDALPEMLRARTLSLRAFDREDMLVTAELVQGGDAAGVIARMFADPEADYLHAHFAAYGCFAARIDRQ
jgi:hypothetical protein